MALKAEGRDTKASSLTGVFTAEEIRGLERFKVTFCNEHGLPAWMFDRMIQHSERDKDAEWPCDSSIVSKKDFWRAIYEAMPNRNKRSVYRFMRRHFQNSTQKPHHWTPEQDEELVELHAQFGTRWAQIAKLLGRSDDDVMQRWKNKLEHRRTMRRGPWSKEEALGLLEALEIARNGLLVQGKDVGNDIYEMDDSLIAWGAVSDRIQNLRSRQQCADKWRKVRRKVFASRARGNPEATWDPVLETRHASAGQSKSASLSKSPALNTAEFKKSRIKSSEFVISDDDDDDNEHNPVKDKTEDPTNDAPSSASHFTKRRISETTTVGPEQGCINDKPEERSSTWVSG